MYGNPQLQDLAPANQLSNWQFVTLLNHLYEASCDSHVKYSLYYSITTGLVCKVKVRSEKLRAFPTFHVHSLTGPLPPLKHKGFPSNGGKKREKSVCKGAAGWWVIGSRPGVWPLVTSHTLLQIPLPGFYPRS